MAAGMAVKAIIPVRGSAPLRRAGRAPGCLLRQLGRQLRGLDWLQRTERGCRWVAETRPQLNRVPRYGTLLQELACAADPVSDAPQKAPRISRRREEKTAHVEKRSAREKAAERFRENRPSDDSRQRATSRSRGAAEAAPGGVRHQLVQLPETAPEQLIRRLSGDTAAMAKRARPSLSSPEPGRFSAAKQPAPGRAKTPAPRAQQQRSLLEILSRRARRQLRSSQLSSETAATRLTLDQVPQQPPRQAELESQWRSPIAAPLVNFYAPNTPATDSSAGKPGFRHAERSERSRLHDPALKKPLTDRQFAPLAEPAQRPATAATDPVKTRFRQAAFAPGRPEPSLRQLLQQAHSRDGERLLAPDDDPNPFTVEKQPVPATAAPRNGSAALAAKTAPSGREPRGSHAGRSGRENRDHPGRRSPTARDRRLKRRKKVR